MEIFMALIDHSLKTQPDMAGVSSFGVKKKEKDKKEKGKRKNAKSRVTVLSCLVILLSVCHSTFVFLRLKHTRQYLDISLCKTPQTVLNLSLSQ